MGFNRFLERTIAKSQQCNRNWDLTKEMPEEDIKTMIQSVTQCSSKQNRVFYKVIITQDRNKIEKIHDATDGFITNFETQASVTNSQVLANTLFAFVKDREPEGSPIRTNEEYKLGVDGREKTDEDRAVGIAAGYLTLTANLLGYESGCCQCFDEDVVQDLLGTDEEVMLLMGVGYGDKSRGRKEHHNDPSFIFPSLKKDIKVEIV
jgi:nitroreductase